MQRLGETTTHLLRALTRLVLSEWDAFDWELWKTGMLRTDLDDHTVLHVWDRRYRDESVTMYHDHPFAFESVIVAGRLINQRYKVFETGLAEDRFWKSRIVCGDNACELEQPKRVYLAPKTPEVYSAGERYEQHPNEVHATVPHDEGAVTLVTKSFNEDRDTAHVYIRQGEVWGDAKPRAARPDEVAAITQKALLLFQ